MTNERKRLTFVEIDIPFGSCTYGVAPCTAVLGTAEEVEAGTATGTRKCFNSIATCQDRPHFTESIVTLRFAEPADYLVESGIDAIAAIQDVSFSPAIISLGENLGVRASLDVTFGDHPWPDTGPGYDKYVTERPYDPYKQGTYWGKFRARQPFLQGRAIRLIRGYLGQALEDMDTRHYFIESTDGPTNGGTFKVSAKDILKLADGDRSQAPKVSNGFLVADIDAASVIATLTPSGVGAQYPDAGWVAIGGKEVCAFTRDLSLGNDANTKLLLHCDGADASTTITDASTSARTVTVNGNLQLDTAWKKFGIASMLFSGSGAYATVPDSPDWAFGTGDFTVDGWLRVGSLAAQRTIFSQQTDGNNRMQLFVTTAGAIGFTVTSSSSTIITLTSASGLVAVNAEHHFALVRHGTAFVIYLDGVSVATVTDADAVPNYTGALTIGMVSTSTNPYLGWMDEFRISAVARWTAAFTPPAGPYLASIDELALTRAQWDTDAVEHTAQDRVQLCLYYEAMDPADIIADLFENYTPGITSEFIPIESWQAETGAFLRRVYTTRLAEPTSVNSLVSELIEQAALVIWQSDRTEQIRLQVLRQIATDAAVWDHSNIIEGSFSLKDQPSKRISQVWVYFGMINPLGKVDDPSNYRSCEVTINTDAEQDNGSPAIKKIFSRWIPAFGRTVAARLGAIQLGRYSTAPRRFNFDVSVNEDPRLGTGYQLTGGDLYTPMQDATGANEMVPIQITSLEPRNDRYRIEAEEVRFIVLDPEDLGNRVIVIDANALNLDLRAIHDTLYPPLGEGDTVTFIVNDDVIVGSAEANLPAMTVGEWPDGFKPRLELNGRIEGAGGDGGSFLHDDVTSPGEDGGPALYTRNAIDVAFGPSAGIWGGGGGGGASAKSDSGNGGGGGAGQVPGSGGASGSYTTRQAAPGTATAGGLGGSIGGSGALDGGSGGGPGEDGLPTAGTGTGNGLAGLAIDGVSYINIVSGSGDIRGDQAN